MGRWLDAALGVWIAMGFLVIAGVDASAQVIGPNRNISGGTDPSVENAPSIAVSGNLIAASWFRNVFNTNLRVALSRDGGITWMDSTIQRPPEGGVIRGRASICIDGTGSAVCAVNAAVSGGATVFIYRASSADIRPVWVKQANAVLFSNVGDGSIDGVKIFSNRATGTLHLVCTRVRAYEGRIHYVRSVNNAMSWSAPLELSSSPQCNTAQPVVGADGHLYVLWEDYVKRAIVGRKSTDDGVSFGPEFIAGPIADNIGVSPPNWRASVARAPMLPNMPCMDVPAFLGVAPDTSHGPHRGALYAVWTDYALGSADPQANRFVKETEPNDDFGNATPIEIGDDFGGGMLSADEPPYLGDCDKFTFEGSAGTTIQVTGSATECITNGGCFQRAWGFNLIGGNDPNALTLVGCSQLHGNPPFVYTLPTTGRYYIDMDCSSSGTVSYALKLRQYVLNPGQAAQDHRDIIMVRSTDGGATWSEKLRVNDDLPHYDNAMPAVAVDGSGRVHVAWYDRRDLPDYGARVNTYWTWSEDGGVSFHPSRRVSDSPSMAGMVAKHVTEHRWLTGDHLALQAEGERVHLAWTYIPASGDGEIYSATITDVPTGIAVARFGGELIGGHAVLTWDVGDSRSVSAFRVHRAVDASDGYTLAAVIPADNSRQYRWADTSVMPGHSYRYRLEVFRESAESIWEGPIEVQIGLDEGNLRWRGASPNPFSQAVDLALEAPRSARIHVEVFDILGHQVGTLRPRLVGDRWLVSWDGTDGRGRNVAPGVYLVQAEVSGIRVTQRIVRMR